MSPRANISIVWLRNDLRLADNPALTYAVSQSHAIIPLYVQETDEQGNWPAGAASRWWLHHSLTALHDSLAERGVQLILRSGSARDHLLDLIRTTGARQVLWNRRYDPALLNHDRRLDEHLQAGGCAVTTFNGSLLREPSNFATLRGTPYKVFTPFWKRLKATLTDLQPLPAPNVIPTPQHEPDSLTVDDLNLLPSVGWDSGFRDTWTPGESGAQQRLDAFLSRRMADYSNGRNRPDHSGTSELSPHLHFGEISPQQVVSAVNGMNLRGPPRVSADAFLSEIGWREFGYHLLYHFPETTDQPLRKAFTRFPWATSPSALRAWQQGQTGFPIVDAGMRQLWATGWMHNRVRMIVGSFLTKDLLQPWQQGARWFWDTLVDADLASNTLGWQWISGCGADASPFFRIFNPVRQGKTFDPEGTYVRRWIPELSGLSSRWIHQPWAAPRTVLAEAGVTLGTNYPKPIVDHREARQAALAAYRTIAGR